MAIANIELKINTNDSEKTIILESGSLRYIDSVITSFSDAESLKKSPDFSEKLEGLSPIEIKNSKVVLSYIKNNNEKIKLQPIYNDSCPILTRANAMEDELSETEKARKLLFSSRNNLFLLLFLNNQTLVRTTYSSMKMNLKEYRIAKDAGLSVFMKDGEHRVIMRDLLKYKLSHNKLGAMRTLYEDTLEEWKKRMLNYSSEDLYFYSRELRRLLNEYDYKKIPRRAVYNLSFNKRNVEYIDNYKINKDFEVVNTNTLGLYKKKVLEDKKSA